MRYVQRSQGRRVEDGYWVKDTVWEPFVHAGEGPAAGWKGDGA